MSNQLPTLYKKTKTGAIQEWTPQPRRVPFHSVVECIRDYE